MGLRFDSTRWQRELPKGSVEAVRQAAAWRASHDAADGFRSVRAQNVWSRSDGEARVRCRRGRSRGWCQSQAVHARCVLVPVIEPHRPQILRREQDVASSSPAPMLPSSNANSFWSPEAIRCPHRIGAETFARRAPPIVRRLEGTRVAAANEEHDCRRRPDRIASTLIRDLPRSAARPE